MYAGRQIGNCLGGEDDQRHGRRLAAAKRVERIRVEHLLAACVDEFKENEDLPNTTNPDDWAKLSGRRGERIVFMRTLAGGSDKGGRTIPVGA